MMLLNLCRKTNNFFVRSSEEGRFKIEDSVIRLGGDYLEGQYIAVTGSVLNNGLYLLTDTLYTLEGTENEEFKGVVYGLAVPREFIDLANEIEDYVIRNPASNIKSYSFGNSSASYAVSAGGQPAGWPEVFAHRLRPFKRMFKQIPL